MNRSSWSIVSASLTAFLIFACPAQTQAYLKLGVDVQGRTVALRWSDAPVQYYLSENTAPNVTLLEFRESVERAFDEWQRVPSAWITYQFAGFTTARPGQDDGWSTIGFLAMPQLDRVLASTSFLVDDLTGELIESDIFFNTAFRWSTSASGEPGHFDLQSIALHEIGHLSGLGHSALGETELLPDGGRMVLATDAVMFPIAFPAGRTSNRTLRPDDIAGISDIYPDRGFARSTGSLSGRVTKNGRGLFGAHVAAFDPATGTLVGNFALNDSGAFSISGLAPGVYVVRVEPLDDADVDSFFDSSIPIDLNFQVSFHSRLIVVPRGGDSGTIQIRVSSR
jgi:hypothetical protein